MGKKKMSKDPAAKNSSYNSRRNIWIKVVAIVLAALMILSVVFFAVNSL